MASVYGTRCYPQLTASSASSLTNNNFSRLRGLRITVVRAISTLAILVLCIITTQAVSIGGVFSHHTTTSLYVSTPVSHCHSPLLHPLDSTNVNIRRCNPVCEASIAAYPRTALVNRRSRCRPASHVWTPVTTRCTSPTGITNLCAPSLNGLVQSPAPDEYIDHVSRLPVSVAIYHSDDFVEITQA